MKAIQAIEQATQNALSDCYPFFNYHNKLTSIAALSTN